MTAKIKTAQLKKFPTYDEFITRVIRDLGLADVPKDTMNDLRDQIEHMLDVRIMDTVIGSFTDDEFLMIDYLMANYDDLDEMDAVLVIATEKPHLAELLQKMLDELLEDLRDYSNRVQAFLAEESEQTQKSTQIKSKK